MLCHLMSNLLDETRKGFLAKPDKFEIRRYQTPQRVFYTVPYIDLALNCFICTENPMFNEKLSKISEDMECT